MQKYNQLINNKLNFYDLFLIVIFGSLPISIIIGNAALNLNILIIDITFLLYCIKFKFWSWLKSKIFQLLLILYFFLIINSIFSFFFVVQNETAGLERSILFIKFILLIFAFSKFLENKYILDIVKGIWLIISLIVIFDIFYEKYFGRNILGYTSPNDRRVVSLFKDELIAGGYVLCFGYTAVTYFLNKKLNLKSTLLFLIIFLLIPIVIFLSGERSNFIKGSILFLVVIYFFKSDKIIFNSKYLITLFIFIISCFLYFNENMKNRYFQFFNRIVAVENNANFYDKFQNITYIAHYDTAIKIFKNYPISGVGNKNFRIECYKDIYFEKKIKLSGGRCATHPHQIHFEILSEQGLIGYLYIIFIFGYFIFWNIKIYLKSKNIHHLNNLTFLALFFLPILPGGGIFSTFNGSLFWIILSLCNLNCKSKI